jgi:hypothetical protein
MNTITINTTNEDGTTQSVVTYTEAEVLHFRKRMQEIDVIQQNVDNQRKEMREIRNAVRDFFSEGEWNDGEQTINKPEVNELLDAIGCAKLTTKYRGNFTIYGTFEIDAEDEDEIDNVITENMSVDCYAADIDVDSIELNDIEETD